MATVNHTGAIAANETWNIVADTHNITGNVTINDAVTVTINHSGGTNQADLIDISVTGAYVVTVNGSIVSNGTHAKRPVWKSSSATPDGGDWVGLQYGAADVGNSVTYNDFWHSNGIDLLGTYAGNLTLNKNRFFVCGNIFDSQSTTAINIGDIWCERCISDDANEMVRALSSGSVTVGIMVVKDCRADCIFGPTSTGTITCAALVSFNTSGRDNYLLMGNNGTGANITITKLWGMSWQGLMTTFVAGETCDINGGRWDQYDTGVVMTSCVAAGVTCDDVDFYLKSYALFCSGGGGNLTNCYVFGGTISTVHQDHADVTAGGTANSIAEVTTNIYADATGMDSVITPKSAPNYPLTFSAFALSSATDNGFTAACTPQCPGETFIYIGTATVAAINQETDLDGYTIQFDQGYDEWIDFSGDNKLITQVTSRSAAIDFLEPGQTYYCRAVCRTPWGDLYWSTEASIAVAAAAVGGGFMSTSGD